MQVRILINGTQLQDVAIDQVNQTEGAGTWTYTAGNINRIDVLINNNMTVFFPQNNNTQFATLGRTLEGNFLNTLVRQNNDRLIDLAEAFNPSKNAMQKLEDLFRVDKQKFYEIILKAIKDRLGVSSEKVKNFLLNSLEIYKQEKNLDLFFDKIENKIRNVTDGFAEP